MMSLQSSTKLAFARGITSGLLRAGHWVFTWPMDISELRSENQILREQNLRLSLELLQLREAKLENVRLRELLGFGTQVPGPYLAAKVVARDPDRIQNTIMVDVGTQDGVLDRMPVVTADGLVGRVLEAHPRTAVVQLLLDRNCRVSAIVQNRGRAQGIVTNEDGYFQLKHVGIRSEVKVGDLVISSGLGGVFPKGLRVGKVTEVGNQKRGLFRDVTIRPSVDFRRLEEVFVLRTIREDGAG